VGAARLGRVLVAAIVAICLGQSALFGAAPAAAQRQLVDPRDIALTPADLPPGFVVAEDDTTFGPMTEAQGVILTLVMEREATPEHVRSGPLYVTQFIARSDAAISFSGFLDSVRQRSIQEDGFSLVPDAPNDGGTASLMKIQGDVAAYEVGFIKHDTVVFTRWIGHRSVVDLDGVLSLAGITSARYDQVLAGRPPSPASAAPRAAAPASAARAARSTPVPTPTPRSTVRVDSALVPAWRQLMGMKDAKGETIGTLFGEVVEATGVRIVTGQLPRGGAAVFRGRTSSWPTSWSRPATGRP
jgi:hypothetical protein